MADKIVKRISGRNRISPEQKLIERCAVLAEVVRDVAPLYRRDTTTPNQRQLLETMIGAAIWYFPQGRDLWTSFISLQAVQVFHPANVESQPKLTADHEYPRKVAAMELLSLDWAGESSPGDRLLKLYKAKYGRFNYVTPRENKRLVNFQKDTVFQDPLTAYRAAGIQLIQITALELGRIKARDKTAIEELMARHLAA